MGYADRQSTRNINGNNQFRQGINDDGKKNRI